MPSFSRLGRRRAPENQKVCGQTGLMLQRAGSDTMYRIAKPSYGPMNPPKRSGEAQADRMQWGRFDVSDQQTIYGGDPEDVAYAESLATFRIARDLGDLRLGDVFENEGRHGRKSLLDAINEEWQAKSHMAVGKIPAGWRDERNIYELRLPSSGWIIDICHSQTLAALNDSLSPLMAEHSIDQLTSSHIHSENRSLTTRLSEWVFNQTLDDGSLPHGIRFPSKHGDDFTCYAIYLRALGDGKSLSSEPTKIIDGRAIEQPAQNPSMERITKLFHLQCF